ncbi:hypothetical protein ACT3UQ_14625 [Glutamicibacter sp. AOP12-B1-11]|nr:MULTISPECIES: hypothetical protein [unclassified Arthrobacter]
MSTQLIGTRAVKPAWRLQHEAQPVVGTPTEFYLNFGQPIYP